MPVNVYMFHNFSDIDECISGSQECDNKTTECMDIEGSYICLCRQGYTGSIDVRQCEGIH